MLDWSMGDTARQRTQGKSWYWEWAGQSLMANERNDVSMIQLIVDGERISPVRNGQFVSEPHLWKHVGSELTLKRQLTFTVNSTPTPIWMSETFTPTVDGRGFERRIEFSRLPVDSAVEVQLLDAKKPFTAIENVLHWKSHDDVTLTATVTGSRVHLIRNDVSVHCSARESRAVLSVQLLGRR